MKNNSLDLHGIKHVDVPREIDKFMGEHLMSGTKSVIIITGNSDMMKKIVGQTLSDYCMEYIESWFNTGEVLINLS